MPYNNFSFVVDSSFTPFTMQEMLVPFAMYKEAFEKSEEDYIKLSSEADKFKYLSETLPEDSKARQLYEGYANGLRAQAEDLANNGLTMNNRRALTDYKRRYEGEIGRLVEADTALKAEKEMRRKMAAQDPSLLYALSNNELNIDSFIDGSEPNLYSVSGNQLYAKGAAAGKAESSRVYSAGDAGSTLGGYYRDFVQQNGHDAAAMAKFRQDMSTIPALQQRVDDILAAEGVLGNLRGESLKRARQQVINGIIDGAVYTETHSPQIDRGVPSWTEKQNAAQGWAQLAQADRHHNDSLAIQGWTRGKDGKLVQTGVPSTSNITVHPMYINGQGKEKSDAEKKSLTDSILAHLNLSDFIVGANQASRGRKWYPMNKTKNPSSFTYDPVLGQFGGSFSGKIFQQALNNGSIRFLSDSEKATIPDDAWLAIANSVRLSNISKEALDKLEWLEIKGKNGDTTYAAVSLDKLYQ